MSKLSQMCLAGLAVAAFAAGCGGGDGEEASSDPPPGREKTAAVPQGKAAFDRQAEEICEAGRNRVLRNLEDFQKENGTLNPRDIGSEAVEVTFLPVFREEVEQLSKLEVPAGDEKQVAALLAERQRALDEIEQKGLSSNLELAEALKRSDRLMALYGLESCTFS